MTDKAKEQAFERAQERAVMNYNAWCAGAINLQPDESRFFFDAGYAAALASRTAELQKYASVIYDIETRCMLYNGTTVAREVLGLLESAGYVNARGFADHPAVTPLQPKTEPCTCNAQRDGDMQWTHAPNCPRSESWQRRVAKDASAAEPERCGVEVTWSGFDTDAHGVMPCGNRVPCADHPEPDERARLIALDKHERAMHSHPDDDACSAICHGAGFEAGVAYARATPAVTPLQAPTDEGGSDFAWLIERTDGPIPTYWDGRATRNNHGPRVTYHHDANSAVRFARQEDAERIIAWLLEGEPVVAREHGWFRATAAPSDPQPSEQEEEAAFRTWRDQNGLASHRAAFDAGREYERKHCPAIDIEDIIKHCRLSLDAKSVSLPELRKALQKATGKEKVNGE